MTAGEVANTWGSAMALAGSAAFVVVYTLLARWWRDPVGRLLVTKAAAIAAFMAISIAVSVRFGDVEYLRWLRGILAALFGVLMLYQAGLVARTQIKGARRDHADT